VEAKRGSRKTAKTFDEELAELFPSIDKIPADEKEYFLKWIESIKMESHMD